MPERSVHCCITSPPYYGLRDYGVEGQIGLEETPAEFITRLVEVFREVRRALRDDGACWVNMGDSYAGSWGAQGRPQGNGQKSGRSAASARRINEHPRFQSGTNVRGREMGLKAKDLVGMPWRLAFALQADGWYLRQDIVWNKQPPDAGDHPRPLHQVARVHFRAEQIRSVLLRPDSDPRASQPEHSRTAVATLRPRLEQADHENKDRLGPLASGSHRAAGSQNSLALPSRQREPGGLGSRSKGACLEYHVASELGMQVFTASQITEPARSAA